VTPGPVLVFGATGTHGGAVAKELLARAVPVQVLVRDPHSERAQALAKNGAHLVVGDLRDQQSLARAMSGAAVAYAITTPFEEGADAEARQGRAIIGAAVEARLPWLIFASVAAATRADVPHFQSKARIEERLRDAPIPWTVVAPSYFYENVIGSRAAILQGLLPLPLPVEKPLHQVGLRDLGAVVAAILDPARSICQDASRSQVMLRPHERWPPSSALEPWRLPWMSCASAAQTSPRCMRSSPPMAMASTCTRYERATPRSPG
jgi:uncharacterized protein YbjT (DUF2867 family)